MFGCGGDCCHILAGSRSFRDRRIGRTVGRRFRALDGRGNRRRHRRCDLTAFEGGRRGNRRSNNWRDNFRDGRHGSFLPRGHFGDIVGNFLSNFRDLSRGHPGKGIDAAGLPDPFCDLRQDGRSFGSSKRKGHQGEMGFFPVCFRPVIPRAMPPPFHIDLTLRDAGTTCAFHLKPRRPPLLNEKIGMTVTVTWNNPGCIHAAAEECRVPVNRRINRGVAVADETVRRNEDVIRRSEIVFQITIPIRSTIAVTAWRQRCPADMVVRLTPGDPGGSPLGIGHPNPADPVQIDPSPVMIGRPAEGLI